VRGFPPTRASPHLQFAMRLLTNVFTDASLPLDTQATPA
jgi:hypothetical protein